MDAVAEARERYQDALDALDEQRRMIEEDLEFSDPTDPQQWDQDEKRAREADPGGARPCLVMDQCGQYVANVAGQVEQQPPAIHAIPVGDGADRKVAEKLDGLYRHIEHASRASQHYSRALTSAARCGVGYLIVRPEYTDRALKYQEPRISSEGDPLRVVFDPWSIELDGSDATQGWLLTPFSHREFERQFGEDKEKISFGDDAAEKKGTDERESIIVAEEWIVESEYKQIVVFNDPQGSQGSMPKDQFLKGKEEGSQMRYVREFKDKTKVVHWKRMSGTEILTEESEYPADSIGLVPVYGYVGWSQGRMRYCGIPRRAREPQRAYNFHVSEIRCFMGQAPKSPWIVPVRAIAGLERLWDRASADSRAYLPYNDVAEDGSPIQQPQRTPVTMNLQNHIESAQQALRDIQASIGMYQANLGAPSNETSGVAIENRKQQGEASTSNFPANLAASLGQVGKICVEMIPRLIDTKRQLRIIGIDLTPSSVVVDPKQQQGLVEAEAGVSINPNVGKYDVRVVIGASFSTQRQQAQQAYTEMMRANPEMMPAIAPLWAQTLDVPHADKLAQVLTAMAPDAVKAILQPDEQETTASLKAQNDQLKQALNEAIQHAKDAQGEADEAQQKLQKAEMQSENKDEENEARVSELEIKRYDSETKRLQALGTTLKPEDVQALTMQTIQEALAQAEPTKPPEPEPEGDDVNDQQVQELMQGQEQLAELLTTLIKFVQHPRERIPVRSKDGSIERVIDRMSPSTETVQ